MATIGHSADGGAAKLSMTNESRLIGGTNLGGGLTVLKSLECGLYASFLSFQGADWEEANYTDRPFKP